MAAPAPDIVRTVAALRERVRRWRKQSVTVGLVPTMGALHEGHLSLVRRCLADNVRAVVSIFVNPAQFAPHEDFASYPRDESADTEILGALGAHLVFAPDRPEMYAEDFATAVTVAGVSEGLCGDSRPHFFRGVATVVTKLLLQCLPDRAYFGEKDYQQLMVVRRLVRDLDIPVEIVGLPTVREADGLALSSRNAYLSAAERRAAPALHRTLREVARRVALGEPALSAAEWGRAELAAAGFAPIDYLEIRDADTLHPVADRLSTGRSARAFAAAYLGRTRLIDNVPVTP